MTSIAENIAVQNFCTMENPILLNVENRLTHQVDESQPNADCSQIDMPGADQNTVEGSSDLGDIWTATLDPGHRGEEQELCHNDCDSQQATLNDQQRIIEPITASNNFNHMEEIENEVRNWDGESHLPEAEWLNQDECVALWVKWRGKWQAGIRCARADCPLSTLKARPTHDRKKYFVVFFPLTRNYSWADMLLVRPIHEFPEPNVHRTHSQGLEKVKDLSLPRRFIMQRLAVGMVNITDQLHNEAVIEAARKVAALKEFAMEASQCNGYSDLGRMLLKLQSMISERYIDPNWLQSFSQSWAKRCQNAQSAEAVETLKEELVGSVLWNKIEALWDAPVQPELGSEWKTWKQEVMKWFSTSNPMANGRDMELCDGDDSTNVGFQISRKRPKLEVRRAEMHAAQVEDRISHEIQPQIDTAEIDSVFFDRAGLVNANTLIPESCRDKCMTEEARTADNPDIMVDKWDGIVVETANTESVQTTVVQEMSMDGQSVGKPLDNGNKFRQCRAFIEAKGRQCIRWANDGDDYCCVHLAIRDKSPKLQLTTPVDAPMCEGTTTHGTKCKHRSQYGSSFCKKHRLQPSQYLVDTEKPSCLPTNTLKRSYSEMNSSTRTAPCQELMLVDEVRKPANEISICSIEGQTLDRGTILVEKSDHTSKGYHDVEPLSCIGSCHQTTNDPCPERAKLHTLYCEKHIPAFLKRARNGRSRIISKEVFVDFLRKCSSLKQKLHLHRACVLLYNYVKGVSSRRNPVPKETQLQWILSEASKDLCVGEYIMKLVSIEREKLKRFWDFDVDNDKQVSSSVNISVLQPESVQRSHDTEINVKCKICLKEFSAEKLLGPHWMDIHKKEARWLFRGYACAICLTSFTSKKILETHGKEKHQVQFLEQCMMLKCIPCGSHFVNSEQLWSHVLSVHPKDLKICTEPGNIDSSENNCVVQGGARRFICKFCGLKFDILPDLGRHHQAAHMGLSSVAHISPKRGTQLNNHYKSKSGRLSRPSFTKGLGAASFRIRNRGNMRLKKRFQASSSVSAGGEKMQIQEIQVAEVVGLGRLAESQCSAVAKSLFSEIQKAKPRPSNLDILCVARSTCCKISLQAALVDQYGVLPDRLYLKAAKLCSELNIRVEWHQEGYVCPKGCTPVTDSHNFFPLLPLPQSVEHIPVKSEDPMEVEELEMDECHYIIESQHIQSEFMQKAIVLCEDLSFGRESVPVNCVVDEDLVSSLRTVLDEGSNSEITICPMPWDNFTYATERFLDTSLRHDTESSQLGCACPHSICSPEACDHVYLFDNDYENAKDIYGQPMQGRFPYDKEGRIILEEGYLVYECNASCSCDKSCPNRVLQNGVQVKLEVFKTQNKGWAVRAGETILRGTFVCEYIGEVINDEEANKRHSNSEDCSYLYKIDARSDDMNEIAEGVVSHVLDATRYGNVSRFINHSCSPNLICYQVLVESMDCQLAHIGFYASRNIAVGEELAYNYREKQLLSRGHTCYCSAPNCQGHVL
ncbi:hypothetical protein AQUCO_00700118v1 [Aquilegia coerulea]|uniref:Histone-lysine N-methyltransferase SUVR5 n=1 Tax=Aquilegia coerulea TaxID=218851 RepID=A0A2G5EIJ5_AQUCA|nr:hypothetical protein AQUCO_00700118v1 [Aquilegia coerulea]PIA55586.1 hypothetical protein AQUCO_00700118v1 [Aquilegia coerulea]PIA55588.1 hypothetical protein AQUCO_00700118v1 [Aquilegia coerulea]PIA55589.1 hypothetical protein AQUCO_00700118v1 [Aquilegia coerulea]